MTNDLRRRLAAREWAPGEQIDTFRMIQQKYGISGVSGVQNALAPLIQEGLLEGRQGRGTYVLRLPSPTPEPTSAEQARAQADAPPPRTTVCQALGEVTGGISTKLLRRTGTLV
ncbi:GntR family transcriptional regulator [Pseudonocardia sp. N23]|uniref:GntR family transcriptional regulator n=1 Tax=Pseudonocardia sp. N23 TaxID=1987376 RepID=UPI0015585381|nr:GntR family transcriptional regulator [Pseudonocardia sp. N23]